MAISIAEARRRGWLKDELKPTKAKKPKEVTHWTRDNLKDWYGPNGWHVGIARQLREGAMIDLVVAWQGSIPKIHEMAVWAEFKVWSIEETEARLKALEDKDATTRYAVC